MSCDNYSMTSGQMYMGYVAFDEIALFLQTECQNYIRVLLVNKTEVMTCGTNAFQPLCITREVSDDSIYSAVTVFLGIRAYIIHSFSPSLRWGI